jgi:hypothetical protein
MAYPFGGSTAASMGIWFTPRIRRFSHKSNPQLLIIPHGRPPLIEDVLVLIKQMARENATLGV